MSFKQNLDNILIELENHKNKSNIYYYVQKRLDESLSQYYKELNQSMNYLSDNGRDIMKLAKRINKEDR